MRIDFLCNDGSPLGIIYEDIYGQAGRVGIGGAELALLTLCEQFGMEGYSVRLYNNPRGPSENPYFEQRPLSDFNPQEEREVLVIFRSPNHRAISAKGLKVWWSCDPSTVGDYRSFSSTVQRIVGISDYHKKKFESIYKINNMEVIDLPVRIHDYEICPLPERINTKALFASVPDRGLPILRTIWPVIHEKVPESELIITSDYRLWGEGPLNEQHRLAFSRVPGVKFLGAITRDKLVQEQLSSNVLIYPAIFEELFCITCAEASVAGCLPITSDWGALPTTNMYKVLPGFVTDGRWQAEFAEAVVFAMQHPDEDSRKMIRQGSARRFDPKRVSRLWRQRIFR